MGALCSSPCDRPLLAGPPCNPPAPHRRAGLLVLPRGADRHGLQPHVIDDAAARRLALRYPGTCRPYQRHRPHQRDVHIGHRAAQQLLSGPCFRCHSGAGARPLPPERARDRQPPDRDASRGRITPTSSSAATWGMRSVPYVPGWLSASWAFRGLSSSRFPAS